MLGCVLYSSPFTKLLCTVLGMYTSREKFQQMFTRKLAFNLLKILCYIYEIPHHHFSYIYTHLSIHTSLYRYVKSKVSHTLFLNKYWPGDFHLFHAKSCFIYTSWKGNQSYEDTDSAMGKGRYERLPAPHVCIYACSNSGIC